MTITVVVATYGDEAWHARGLSVACRSVCKEDLVVAHLRDGTLAEARNQGAAEAAGEWLCFLDADDQLAPGYLDAMRDAAASRWRERPGPLLVPKLSFVHGRIVSPATFPNAGRWPDLNECVIGTLVRRAHFLSVGGFNEWTSLEDWDLWLRCFAAGSRLVRVPDATYLAARSPQGRNSDQSAYRSIRDANAGVFATTRSGASDFPG